MKITASNKGLKITPKSKNWIKPYLKDAYEYYQECGWIPCNEELAEFICSAIEDRTGLDADYDHILKILNKGL